MIVCGADGQAAAAWNNLEVTDSSQRAVNISAVSNQTTANQHDRHRETFCFYNSLYTGNASAAAVCYNCCDQADSDAVEASTVNNQTANQPNCCYQTFYSSLYIGDISVTADPNVSAAAMNCVIAMTRRIVIYQC